MSTTVNRRRSRIVDVPAQARLVWRTTLVPLCVLLASAAIMWVLGNRLIDEARLVDAELPSLGLVVMMQFVFVAAAGAVVVLRAFYFSHHVVGPASKIAASLRRVRDGESGVRIRLRDGDELAEVADELNLLLDHLDHGGGAGPEGRQQTERTEARAPSGDAGREAEAALMGTQTDAN